MKIMFLVGDTLSDTCVEMIRQSGMFNSVYEYTSSGTFKNNKDFDNDQKNFDCIYTPNPEILLRLKPKIPYFYDVPCGTFAGELNFKVFDKYYSQLSGASAVFVSDKKMSRYASWEGLNTFWVNEGVAVDRKPSFTKKFFTPKLSIGFFNDFNEDLEILKDVVYASKSNWEFHIYNSKDIPQLGNIKFYEGDVAKVKETLYNNCHIMLRPSVPKNDNIKHFPSNIILESMLTGCVNVCGNIHDNSDGVLFDNYHYFKLDYIDANTVLSTLRYADNRRDKLSRMSESAHLIVKKYFDSKLSAKLKLQIISKHI